MLLRRLLRYLLRLLGIGRRKNFRVHLCLESISGIAHESMGFYFHKLEESMSLTVTIGDTGTHTAILTATNLDGSPATDVTITYSSSDPAIVAVDATSGALTIVAVGRADITGTGTRGTFSHSDTGTVTVEQGDFGVTLALT